jgi:hypothetical protein
MPFAISPVHISSDFDYPLSLNNKIEVFIARVNGWQIGPALDFRDNNIPHRGFAQLLIVSSYFEMIGKYRGGFTGENSSYKYFKEGLLYTFPEISPDENDLLKAFYKSVRNGLYHVGMTKSNVILDDSVQGSFGYSHELNYIRISPDRFVEDIQIRFNIFTEELLNPKNVNLRENFEKRFDSDNS